MVFKIDAPFLGEDLFVERAGRAVMRQRVSNIKANAARAHNRHALADGFAALQHINIADRFFMGDALNIWHAGADAGGHHHMLELIQHIGVHACVELQRNA